MRDDGEQVVVYQSVIHHNTIQCKKNKIKKVWVTCGSLFSWRYKFAPGWFTLRAYRNSSSGEEGGPVVLGLDLGGMVLYKQVVKLKHPWDDAHRVKTPGYQSAHYLWILQCTWTDADMGLGESIQVCMNKLYLLCCHPLDWGQPFAFFRQLYCYVIDDLLMWTLSSRCPHNVFRIWIINPSHMGRRRGC